MTGIRDGYAAAADLPDLPLAACRDTDPEVFFPGPADAEGIAAATGICRGCLERARCGAWALAEGVRYGVWGGRLIGGTG